MACGGGGAAAAAASSHSCPLLQGRRLKREKSGGRCSRYADRPCTWGEEKTTVAGAGSGSGSSMHTCTTNERMQAGSSAGHEWSEPSLPAAHLVALLALIEEQRGVAAQLLDARLCAWRVGWGSARDDR